MSDFGKKGTRKGKKKGCSHCRTSRETGRKVGALMQLGASQAAINRAIENGRTVMDLEKQLRAARGSANESFTKDRAIAQADNL
jgi:hypothetical protein